MVGRYGQVHRYLDSVKDFKERLTGGSNLRNSQIRIKKVKESKYVTQPFTLSPSDPNLGLTTAELRLGKRVQFKVWNQAILGLNPT